MERIIHDLVQGSQEWHQFRLEHDGASEAAAMLGLSKNTTRSELLRVKHSGIAKEFSQFVQEKILDRGHEVEALARLLVEAMIGEDLYPATYSLGRLSASCDGLTMDDETAFEHKQWSGFLAAAVSRKELPEEHQPQCQQVMMVTGAKRVIFVVSDGTADNFEHVEVLPDPAWQERIVAGWRQFHADLAAYTPPEVIPAAVAAPQETLPAVSVQVTGSIAVIDNLSVFGDALMAYCERINQKPQTDQDFADLEATVKALKKAEDALDAAEANALGQAGSLDTLRRSVAQYRDLARANRLTVEKLVKAEKENRRSTIVYGGKDALRDHINALNKRLGEGYMVVPPVDFAACVKGLRTIASIQDAVDTELSRQKIAASEIADRIEINLRNLKAYCGDNDYGFLFRDLATLVLKAPDDFAAAVALRVGEHRAAEAKREEETRQRIRAEEEAKAAAKVKAEQDAAQQAAAITLPAPANRSPEPATQPAAQAVQAPSGGKPQEPAVVAAIDTGATMTLGDINTALCLTVSSDLLAALGFQFRRDRSAKLYRAYDFRAICAALVRHIQAIEWAESLPDDEAPNVKVTGDGRLHGRRPSEPQG